MAAGVPVHPAPEAAIPDRPQQPAPWTEAQGMGGPWRVTFTLEGSGDRGGQALEAGLGTTSTALSLVTAIPDRAGAPNRAGVVTGDLPSAGTGAAWLLPTGGMAPVPFPGYLSPLGEIFERGCVMVTIPMRPDQILP